MAYWLRRNDGKVYAYTRYTDGKYHKKPRQISRTETKKLDGQDDTQVEQWVRDYEFRWEKNEKFQPDQVLLSDELLSAYLEKYKLHLLKYRSKSTAFNRISTIRRYSIPFFLSQKPPMKDPQLWVGVSVKMLEYFEKEKLSWSMICAINTDLRGFYKYLIEEGIVQHGRMLLLRFPKKSEGDKETPLPFVVTPDEMLKFCSGVADPKVKLMGSLGYFFSLRPQEVFGLKKSDFIAKKEKVTTLDCVKHMTKSGLFAVGRSIEIFKGSIHPLFVIFKWISSD